MAGEAGCRCRCRYWYRNVCVWTASRNLLVKKSIETKTELCYKHTLLQLFVDFDLNVTRVSFCLQIFVFGHTQRKGERLEQTNTQMSTNLQFNFVDWQLHDGFERNLQYFSTKYCSFHWNAARSEIPFQMFGVIVRTLTVLVLHAFCVFIQLRFRFASFLCRCL